MLAKTYSWVYVSVRRLDFLFMRWTKNLGLMGQLIMGTSTRNIVCYCKVLRLNAILHDAAGAVRPHSGIRPGYCYMVRRGPNSFLLGQVTGLLFCFFVKLFLPSIFNFINFWSSTFCIVLDIEVTDKNVFRELGLFIEGKFQEYSLRRPKYYKSTKQPFWCWRN